MAVQIVRYALTALAIVAGAGIVEARDPAGTANIGACRDIRDSLLRLRCFDDVSKSDAPGLPTTTTAPTTPNFQRYAVDPYRGPARLPDFRGRDRAHAMYRTRIMEGARAGANFAGHLALVTIGCGSSCVFVPVVDVRTGRVFNSPLGGEDQLSLDLQYKADSRLISARYILNDRCKTEEIIWTGSAFQRGTIRDLGEREACYVAD